MIRLPSVVKKGAKLALPFFVTWRLSEPSAFATQISIFVGRTRFSFKSRR